MPAARTESNLTRAKPGNSEHRRVQTVALARSGQFRLDLIPTVRTFVEPRGSVLGRPLSVRPIGPSSSPAVDPCRSRARRIRRPLRRETDRSVPVGQWAPSARSRHLRGILSRARAGLGTGSNNANRDWCVGARGIGPKSTPVRPISTTASSSDCVSCIRRTLIRECLNFPSATGFHSIRSPPSPRMTAPKRGRFSLVLSSVKPPRSDRRSP